MTFRLLALAGAAGSGKDTAAQLLRHRFDFARAAFAGPLKRGLCAMFDWEQVLLDNREWKEAVMPDIGKSPRQLMQTLGTEWGRNLVHPDLWLLLAQRQVDYAKRVGLRGIVFTDCRFENEAAFVLAQGGHVLHIVRPGTAAVAAHVSESMLPSHVVSAQIMNDGTLSELGDRVCNYVAALADYATL